MKVKIAGKIKTTLVNGEGIRYAIFFQGCDMEPKCSNCHSPHTWNIEDGIETTTEELVEDIKSHIGFIDGVTISGGNPTMQYYPLLELCVLLKRLNLNIWVWTGHEFDIIQRHYSELLNTVDTIIDGRYEKDNETVKFFCGSENQKRYDKINGKWSVSEIE